MKLLEVVRASRRKSERGDIISTDNQVTEREYTPEPHTDRDMRDASLHKEKASFCIFTRHNIRERRDRRKS